MLIVDIIIAVLLGYSLYKGLQKGLVVSIISLFALILGIYISLRFSFYMREILTVSTKWQPSTITIGAFFITFMLVLLVLYFLGKWTTKLIDQMHLGFLNKLGGAIFQGLKMILIISVFLNLFQKINFNQLIVKEETLKQSLFINPIKEVAKAVFPLMEKWYKIALEEAVKGVDNLKQQQSTTARP